MSGSWMLHHNNVLVDSLLYIWEFLTKHNIPLVLTCIIHYSKHLVTFVYFQTVHYLKVNLVSAIQKELQHPKNTKNDLPSGRTNGITVFNQENYFEGDNSINKCNSVSIKGEY